jgi:hypothetical protein
VEVVQMRGRARLGLGAPDLVFGVVLGLGLVVGRTGFLNDPGTFWHIRLGREILRTGAVPRVDGLTFTRAGVPWVDQAWAFDAGLAWLVDRWGWGAAVAATALILAWVYGALTRWLIRDGSSPLVAAVVAILAAGIGSIHFLTRPHLFTIAFFLWTLRACRDYHERGGWAIWSVPLVVLAWANLHGGFLAGPLIVATAGFGHAISGRWDRGRVKRLLGFATVFALSCAAPMVNPYGVGLYRHVAGLLVTSGVTELISEYQPSPFGKAEARVLEWVVLGLIALPVVSRARPSLYDLAHALVWLHLALATVRHAPLFALAAAPVLARLLDGLLSPAEGEEPIAGRWSFWPIAASLAVVAAVGMGARLGGPDPKKWPLAAVPALDRQPVEARLFHEQDWGGLIAERCRPTRRVYLDDRFELFGRERLLEYVEALQGGPTWDVVLDKQGIELVWVRPDCGLARRLAADRGWDVVHRDKVSVLYRKKAPAGGSLAAK